MIHNILFISGTRADFSKIRPLIVAIGDLEGFSTSVFITGMHMLSKYGSTYREVLGVARQEFCFINQAEGDSDYAILAKTVLGLGDYVRENQPDLIVVHGDRMEALAGAIVGATCNIRVAHIEGGEISGTIDDSYRHAISKLSHLHFTSNFQSEATLLQLGEERERIFTIGSPELDLMHSKDLPALSEVIEKYNIFQSPYAILLLHPVATEMEQAYDQAKTLVDTLLLTGKNFVVIESNNDRGSRGVREAFAELSKLDNFRVLPSMRFDHFLTLLKNADFIIGNSSAGVREAPHYGVPSINLGSRQKGRVSSKMVINCEFQAEQILSAINKSASMLREPEHIFGDGSSALRFQKIIGSMKWLKVEIQKTFIKK